MFGYYKLRRKIKEYFIYRKVPEQINFTFKKRNEELFLFGNGYTLNANINLNDLKGSDIFVCNEFYRHPNYNNVIDRNNILHFALDGIGSYEKVTPKMEGLTVEESFEKYLNPILRSGVNVVLPMNVIPYILNNFNDSQICAISSILNDLLKNKSTDQQNQIKNIKSGHTPQGMLLIGILYGYKKIHLHGLEHNYVKDILNKDPKCGTHFYGESYREVLEINDGKGLPREAYKTTLSKLFEGNAKTFKAYEQLADLAKELGVEVIDHSEGSLFMFQDYSLWDLVEPKDKN
jgi:hypothetical protein